MTPPIRDAAAIMLLRGDAPFSTFMLRRTRKAKFMASAMVFPGGRLEASDAADALVPHCDLSRTEAAERLGMADGAAALALHIAALRETFEEAGILLADRAGHPVTEHDPALIAWRARLNDGSATLAEFAAAEQLTLHLSALQFHDHWITPPFESRRYDTRFFIAQAPADQAGAHDAIETTASAWLSPTEALSAYAAGEIVLAPPTLRQLHELAACADARSARALRAGARPQAIQPQASADIEGNLVLALPGDPAFDPPGQHVNRVVMRDGRFVSLGHA